MVLPNGFIVVCSFRHDLNAVGNSACSTPFRCNSIFFNAANVLRGLLFQKSSLAFAVPLEIHHEFEMWTVVLHT